MRKKQDRIIYRRDDGKWANQRISADRPGSVHDTQKAAQAAGRQHLTNAGGGELITKGVDGKIREKTTVPPGNDPHPPKG